MANEISVYRGDDLYLRCTFTEDGSAYDLTDHTLFSTVKENITDTDSSAVLTSTITSFDAATSGIQIVHFTGEETDSLDPKRYLYDLQLIDSEDNVITIVRGTLKVLYDITRRTS